jgi:hypothetical protein
VEVSGALVQRVAALVGVRAPICPQLVSKLRPVVDPGFHHLRLNSLAIEQIGAPMERPSLIFRDFFNRDDHPDANAGVVKGES